MKQIEELKIAIQPLQNQLYHHPINTYIKSSTELERFMSFHVFAVWDFMSLVKKLQQKLTCVDMPWKPVGTPETRFLINEIVLGEESDVDQHGQITSHFELYLKAMSEVGAQPMDELHDLLKCANLAEVLHYLENSSLNKGIRDFLKFTFESIQQKSIVEIAAIFTFGREDLIPGMFQQIVDNLRKEAPEKIETLVYYLDRHIEVDGDHHSHLAYQMLESLCGSDKDNWKKAELAAVESLKYRIALWDSIIQA
jgi:hypothetical protein